MPHASVSVCPMLIAHYCFAKVDREQSGVVPFVARIPTSGFDDAESAIRHLEDERLRLEEQQQEDIRQLRALQRRERAVTEGPKRQRTAEAGYVGLKVTGAPPHAVVQVRATSLLRRARRGCEGHMFLHAWRTFAMFGF